MNMLHDIELEGVVGGVSDRAIQALSEHNPELLARKGWGAPIIGDPIVKDPIVRDPVMEEAL